MSKARLMRPQLPVRAALFGIFSVTRLICTRVRQNVFYLMNHNGSGPPWKAQSAMSLAAIFCRGEILPHRRACIVSMNHFEKLRRSAMSIPANAHRIFIKLRRIAMFVRGFIQSFNIREMRIGTLNRSRLLLLRYLSRLARDWQEQLGRRRGPGRGGPFTCDSRLFVGRLKKLLLGFSRPPSRSKHGTKHR